MKCSVPNRLIKSIASTETDCNILSSVCSFIHKDNMILCMTSFFGDYSILISVCSFIHKDNMILCMTSFFGVYNTRVWGQFWPDTLFLDISSCFMLVHILSVILCEMLVQILSVSYLVITVGLSFPCVCYM